MTTAVYSIEDGVITALAGGPLSLADLGQRTTHRVSHVEHNPATDLYDVTDADTGELLHSDPDYKAALQWEIDYFNQKLLST